MPFFSRNPNTGENSLQLDYEFNKKNKDIASKRRLAILGETSQKNVVRIIDDETFIQAELTPFAKIKTLHDFVVYPIAEEWELKSLKMSDIKPAPLLTKREAVLRLSPSDFNLNLANFTNLKYLATGLGIGNTIVSGEAVFSLADVEKLKNAGKTVIFVRQETSPEDIASIKLADAIVTSTGGLTSHAAIVARGLGKCCVVGCSDLVIHPVSNSMRIKDYTIGKVITVDAITGNIYEGHCENSQLPEFKEYTSVKSWVNEIYETCKC